MDFNETENKIKPLSRIEMQKISGGGLWEDFWRWVGKKVGGNTIGCAENYDQEAELEAIKGYMSPL